jgi:hypothetical protein
MAVYTPIATKAETEKIHGVSSTPKTLTARLVPPNLLISLPPLGDGMSVSVRRWQSVVVAAMVLVAVVMSGCTSPGTPFSYLDVKISVGPSASPAQPVVGQATRAFASLLCSFNGYLIILLPFTDPTQDKVLLIVISLVIFP